MAPTIAAVKYACNGEVRKEFQGVQPQTVYNLQPTHPIFQQGEVSEVSKLIGMPLAIWPIRPSLRTVYRPKERITDKDGKALRPRRSLGEMENEKDWTVYANYCSKEDADYFPNDTAAFLMIACSPSKDTPLLHPPEKWIKKVGSVLVARQDMTPLHPMHVEVLLGFIGAVHKSLTEMGETDYLTAEVIAETVTPEVWQAFWHKAVDHLNQTGKGASINGVPVPFDDAAVAETVPEDNDEGGVQLDHDMMDCSDIGFAQ